jgi:hypothetical protein
MYVVQMTLTYQMSDVQIIQGESSESVECRYGEIKGESHAWGQEILGGVDNLQITCSNNAP